MKKLIIYLILSLLIFAGCKKDKTEPEETQPTKESLLCREWQLEKAYINNEVMPDAGDAGIIEYMPDGSAKVTFHDTLIGESVYFANWRFVEDYKYLEVSELDAKTKHPFMELPYIFKRIYSDEWTRYEIIKLEIKEHILKYTHENGYEYRFEYKAI